MDIVNDLNNADSIPLAFFNLAKLFPDKTVYTHLELINPENLPAEACERKKINRSYKEVSLRIRKIASYLKSQGFKKGDKAAIISNSRPEWLEADLAVLSLGGVSVSVYQSLLASDIAYILYDSGAEYVFAENKEQVKKAHEIISKEFIMPQTEERQSEAVKLNLKKIISFEDTSETSLNEIFSIHGEFLEPDLSGILRDDLACLVYTSGTTGPPKGVIQTHGNHLANVRQAFQAGIYNLNSRIMIVLPLAHSFAKLMGYISFLTTVEAVFPAVTDKFSSKLNADSITRDLGICEATIFPLVPRMFEKMKEGIIKKSHQKNILGTLLNAMLKNAEERGQLLLKGAGVNGIVNFKYMLFSFLRKVIKKKLFSSNFQYAISGGAKLAVDVCRFFNDLGIPVLEGYGLTETCVATNVNRVKSNRIGTVGQVLAPDIELTLSEEGEILFRGPNISKGYLNREQATKSAWDSEGRFHTGDLGAIDNEGFLSITGRKKELIVTAGGKKIAPETIENKLKNIRFVSHAIMVGEGKPYCAALLTVNFHDAKKYLSEKPELTEDELCCKMKELIWKEVEVLNKTLASFESIKKIELLKEDFSIENGLLTPTLKVKRNEVCKRYRNTIEEFYSEK